MGRVLSSNSEEIRSKMQEMVSKCEELQKSLNEMLMKIEDSKGYFDTPTSLYFRDSASTYILERKDEISNSLIPFIEKLDRIADGYEEEFEIEKEMMNEAKGDKND